jgi:hypothetical protein
VRGWPISRRPAFRTGIITELNAAARNTLKSVQKRPSVIAACWKATLW